MPDQVTLRRLLCTSLVLGLTACASGPSPDADIAAADVDARAMECAVEIHAEIQHEGQDLRHRRHDLAPARGADCEPPLAATTRDHGAHVGERAFCRCQGIGQAGPGIEPHDAVIHEDACRGQYDPGAEH